MTRAVYTKINGRLVRAWVDSHERRVIRPVQENFVKPYRDTGERVCIGCGGRVKEGQIPACGH